jgi:predicted DNA-binding transcriptional regulator YafY
MTDILVVEGDQLRRLMKLCRIICGAKGATPQQLQAKLRCSRRTIFRDLKALGTMGVRVHSGAAGYSIGGGAAACRRTLMDHHLKALENFLTGCLK